MTVARTYYSAASFDDTPEKQMCSNEFIENSDIKELYIHHFSVILHSAKSSSVQREVQRPGTNHFKVLV